MRHEDDMRKLEKKVNDNYASNEAKFENIESMILDQVRMLTNQDRELRVAITARMDDTDLLNEERDRNKTAVIEAVLGRLEDADAELSDRIWDLHIYTNKSFDAQAEEFRARDKNKSATILDLSNRLDDVETTLSDRIMDLHLYTNQSFEARDEEFRRNNESKTAAIEDLSNQLDDVEIDLSDRLMNLHLYTNKSLKARDEEFRKNNESKTAAMTVLSNRLEDVEITLSDRIVNLHLYTNESLKARDEELRRQDENKTAAISSLSSLVGGLDIRLTHSIDDLRLKTNISLTILTTWGETHQMANNQSFVDVQRRISSLSTSLDSLEPRLRRDTARLLGASYVRWGKATCPSGSETLYSGKTSTPHVMQ